MVNATLNCQAETKLKTRSCCFCPLGSNWSTSARGWYVKGIIQSRKTLINIPKHVWLYSRRDLHKNDLKWGYNPTTDWMRFWVGALARVTIQYLRVGVNPTSELFSMWGISYIRVVSREENSICGIWMDGYIHLPVGSDEGSSYAGVCVLSGRNLICGASNGALRGENPYSRVGDS